MILPYNFCSYTLKGDDSWDANKLSPFLLEWAVLVHESCLFLQLYHLISFFISSVIVLVGTLFRLCTIVLKVDRPK